MRLSFILQISAFILCLALGQSLFATDGTWTNTASGGTWATTTNWSGGTVASGTDATAYFNTLNITADNTVHLGAALTIGNLIFADTTPSNNWILDNNGSSANILTLAATSGTSTIAVTNQTATISATLAGSGVLLKTGAGTLSLSGSNNYTGGTTISSGTLGISNTFALGIGAVTNNATLNVNVGNATPTGLSNSLIGSGTVNVTLPTGSNTTLLNGDYSGFTGTWNIGIGAGAGAGKVQMNGADNSSATINLLTNSTLYVVGALTKNATLVLNGGDTGESLGQLRLEGGATWAGNITLAGNITGGGDGTVGANSGTGTISGNISESGSRALVKVGGGTTVLSGSNSYTGGTSLNAGTLTYLNTNAKPASGTTTVASGATLALGVGGAGYFSSANVDSLFAGTLTNVSNTTGTSNVGIDTTAGDFTYATSIGSYARSLVKLGANKLTLSGSNSYTGATLVNAGNLTVSGTIGSGGGTAVTTANAGTAFNVSSTNGLTGTSSLTVGVSTTATLSAANNFSGATAVTGTLQLQNAGSVASSSGLTLNNGSALQLRNNSPTTFTSGSTAFPGGATTTIDVNNSGSGSGNTLGLSGTVYNVGTGSSTMNITGGNGYTLSLPTVYLQSTTAALTTTFNPTTANVILGTVLGRNDGTSNKDVNIFLSGTSTGNQITGQIANPANGNSWTYITKQGTGTWTILNSSASNYAGTMSITGGILNIQVNNALGLTNRGTTVSSGATLQIQSASSLNYSTAEALTISGAGYTAGGATGAFENVSGTNTFAGLVTLGAASTISSDAGSLNLSNAGTIYGTSTGFALTLAGAGNGTIVGIINGGASGTPGAGTLTKTGSGKWTLPAANTYTGTTTIENGTLLSSTNAPSGSAGAFGNTTSAIALGNANSISGNLSPSLLTNGAFTVGRDITVGANNTATSGTYTIGGNSANSSTFSGIITLNQGLSVSQVAGGTVNLTGTITSGTSGTQTVTFNNAGAVLQSNGLIGGGTGTIAVTQSGTGTTTFSGSNTYTGATTINAGTLILDHSGGNAGALGATAVSVGGGGTLLVKGTTGIVSGGSLATSASGAIISLQDTTVNTFTVNGGLSLAAGSKLNFEIGSTNGVNDLLAVGSVSATGTSNIGVSAPSGLAAGSTTYTLITASGGLSAGNFQIGSKPAGFNNFSLSTPTATALLLSVSANATPTTAYWTGLASQDITTPDAGNNWSYGSALATTKSNWSTTSDGLTDPLQVPGLTTDVILTASNAIPSSVNTLTTQLDASYSIKGLTIDVPSLSGTQITSTVINPNGNTLTLGVDGLALNATSLSSATLGVGSIQLSASQNWADNNSTLGLTVNSGITAASGSTTLTLSGAGVGGVILGGNIGNGSGTVAVVFNQTGTTQVNGANTYTGGATINSGTVQLGNATALGAASNAVLAFGASSTGKLQLNGNSVTLTDLNTNATVGTPVIESGAATAGTDTLTVNTANTDTYAGVLQNGGTRTLALTKSGVGTLILSGSNTYTGPTIVSTGTLQLQNAYAIASSALQYGSGSTLKLRSDSNATFLTQGVTAAANSDPFLWNINVNNATSGTGNTLILQNVGQLMGANAFTMSTLNVTGGNGYTLQMGGGSTGIGAITFWNNLTLNSNTTGVTLSMPGGVTVNAGFSYTLGFGGAGNTSIGPINAYSAKLLTPTFGGSGTITLNGANNFGAATGTISTTGTLNLGNANSFTGLTALTISGAATIDNTSGSTITLSGNPTQSWNSNFTFAGTNPLNTGTGAVAMNASRQVTVSGTGALTVGGSISGSGFGLTKSGTGTLALTGLNTYSGATAVNNGTLSYNKVASGTNAQSLGSNTGANAVTLGVSGTSSGVLLYTGSTGTLAKNITALGNGADTIQNSGSGLLTLSGTLTKNGTTLTLNGGANGITVSGQIVGASANSDLIVKGGTTTLTNTNSYNGPTYVNNSGTLVNGTNNALPTGTTLLLGGTDNSVGSYDLAGYSQTIASLISQGSGGTSNVITNSSGTKDSELKMNTSGTFAGRIQDGASRKTNVTVDAGTLTLSPGAELALTGTIAINNGGTLLLCGSNQITNAASVNLNGGTFNTGGYNASVGALTLSGSSTIDFTSSTPGNTLTFSGGSYSNGALLTVSSWDGSYGGGNNTKLIFTSPLTQDFLGQVKFDGFGQGAVQFESGELAPIPEPATIIGAFGFLGMLVVRERRRIGGLWKRIVQLTA